MNFATANAFQPTIGGTEDAFVLKLAAASTDVPVRNVTGLVALPASEVTTSFDPNNMSVLYPAGTFRIVAGLDNVSPFTICNPFFQVVELPLADRLQGVWIEPTGLQIQGPVAYPVNHPTVAFEPGARIRFRFDIRLSTTDAFPFFVNVWGTPQAPGTPCP